MALEESYYLLETETQQDAAADWKDSWRTRATIGGCCCHSDELLFGPSLVAAAIDFRRYYYY